MFVAQLLMVVFMVMTSIVAKQPKSRNCVYTPVNARKGKWTPKKTYL